MDATANNAITVLLNITILRQRYRSQSRSSLQVAIVSEIAISFDEPIAQVFASRAGLNLKLEIKSEVRKRFATCGAFAVADVTRSGISHLIAFLTRKAIEQEPNAS